MSTELIINSSLPEVRIALLEDNQIQELQIERLTQKGITGNIYKGRVTRVLPGMQAAFVDIGLEKAAFLYVDDIYVYPKGAAYAEEEEVAVKPEKSSRPLRISLPNRNRVEEPVAVEGEGARESLTAESSETPDVDLNKESEATPMVSELRMEAASEVLSDSERDELPGELDENEDIEDDLEDEEDVEEEEDEEDDEDSDLDSSAENSEGEALEAATEENGPVEAAAGEGTHTESSDSDENNGDSEAESGSVSSSLQGLTQINRRPPGRSRRGRRSRKRFKDSDEGSSSERPHSGGGIPAGSLPSSFVEQVHDAGSLESDRAALSATESGFEGQGTSLVSSPHQQQRKEGADAKGRPELREPRFRDRRIKSKPSSRPVRAQANIADLLKEGQEVIVQVAKDPIATKGARLTCHVSLPGRHLVCMPTIDHVGVSRRIEKDEERRSLREFVEKNRPRKIGFIVRTASSGKDPERWINQDIEYLSKLWTDIREKAEKVTAPALVYEDLSSALKAVRDWVNEDINKIVVDSRYYYNELQQFATRFMPSLLESIELYQGDIPVFDAYGISHELHRSLERRVWLKSGGYIVIDQAEALVAIDVNTGKYVGKKNLEDTILKTNLEAAEEIAYQLRLRNCGGIIIIDFIDMEKEENRQRVYRSLDEALKKDRSRPTIQKISELGLVEMTRKRTRDTIIRSLCEPCTHCEGKGFIKSKRTVAYDVLRELEREGVDREVKKILIQAHADVIDILAIDERDTLDQLERRYRKQIYLQAVGDFHPEQYEIDSDRNTKRPSAAQEFNRGQRSDRGRGGREGRDNRDNRENRENRESRDSREKDLSKPDGAPKNQLVLNTSASLSVSVTSSVAEPRGEVRSEPLAIPLPLVVPKNNETFVAPLVASQEGESSLNEGHRSDSVSQSHLNTDASDDEDMLAYLRAQAAQDAALATFGLAPVTTALTGAKGGQGRPGQGQGPAGFAPRGPKQNHRHGRKRRFERGVPNGPSNPNGQPFRKFTGPTPGIPTPVVQPREQSAAAAKDPSRESSAPSSPSSPAGTSSAGHDDSQD